MVSSIKVKSRPGSNGDEEVLHIPQSSWTRVLPSDSLLSCPELSEEGVLPLGRDAVVV